MAKSQHIWAFGIMRDTRKLTLFTRSMTSIINITIPIIKYVNPFKAERPLVGHRKAKKTVQYRLRNRWICVWSGSVLFYNIMLY